jgi:hypothetical protein
MGAEYIAGGRLKPPGNWLEAGRYQSDHSSFVPTGPGAIFGARMESGSTASEEKTANIWEWTVNNCRLCKTDYVVVECSPFMASESDGSQFLAFALGKVRLELAIDEAFTDGFFVEWELALDSELASVGKTIFSASGTPPVGSEQRASPHDTKRSSFILIGDTAAEADECPHMEQQLPTWVTQQFSHDPKTAAPLGFFPLRSDSADRLFDGTQPVTFVKSVMRFGKLDGTVINTKTDRSPYVLFFDDPEGGFGSFAQSLASYLSIGVHDNRVGASANDSFFSSSVTGDDWLEKHRWSRVKTTTSPSNTFSVTRRRDTAQASGSLNASAPQTVHAKSPFVRNVQVRSITDSAVHASPKTKQAVDAATPVDGPTGPASLVWTPFRNNIVSRAMSSRENNATSWAAGRLRSTSPLLQPAGHPRPFSLNCFAVGKSLKISTTCEFGSIGQSVQSYAKLPSVGISTQAGGSRQASRRSQDGFPVGGWATPPQWSELQRDPAPDRSDYMANPPFNAISNRGTPEEFIAFAQAFESWMARPSGGADQNIGTAGVTGPGDNNTPLVSYPQEWGVLYAQMPTRPWMRYADGTDEITLQNNGGQPCYVANKVPTNELLAIKTLDLPGFYGNEKPFLSEYLDIAERRNVFSGASQTGSESLGLFPRTWFDDSRVSRGVVSAATTSSGAEWKDILFYQIVPAPWYAVYDGYSGGTFVPVGNWVGLHSLEFTSSAWRLLAESRGMAAITSARYTPMQLDCSAMFVRRAAGAITSWPRSSYTQEQAVGDASIPRDVALYPLQIPPTNPGGGDILIHWRKTWTVEIKVKSGKASARQVSSSLTDLGNPAQNGFFIGSPFYLTPPWSQPQYESVVVNRRDENVEVFWPSPNCVEKTFTYCFEDLWTTSIMLSEIEWRRLENGEPVEVYLTAGGGDAESVFENTSSVQFKNYTAAAGTSVSTDFEGFQGIKGNVPARLKMSFQFV